MKDLLKTHPNVTRIECLLQKFWKSLVNAMETEEIFQTFFQIVGDATIQPENKASLSQKARLYGLYKRATQGRFKRI